MENLEKRLSKILAEINTLADEDRIEELTYMAGCAMEKLHLLGAPISQEEIDDFAKRIDNFYNPRLTISQDKA